MHLLTGMILAAILGRSGKGGKKALLPRFVGGPVEVVHVLPGRLRLRAPSLRGDEAGRKVLLSRLPQVDGVERVEVNLISGSVLIQYQPDRIGADLLFAAVVRLLGLEEALERPPLPILTRELRAVSDSLNRAVYEQTGGIVDLWTALLIVMAAVGAHKLVSQRSAAFPAGFTLIWWAVNSLIRGREAA